MVQVAVVSALHHALSDYNTGDKLSAAKETVNPCFSADFF